MRTVAELKRLLRRHAPGEAGEALINGVIQRLKQYKYLNDSQYAATYTRLRQENDKLGKRRVHQDLVARGVHADIIEATLGKAYLEMPEDELARQFLVRKRVGKPASRKEAARAMRMLARAGFSSGAIFKTLRRLKVEEEVLEQMEEGSQE